MAFALDAKMKGLKEEHAVNFDLFAFFSLVLTISIFTYFMTLVDLDQKLALKSLIGAVIGVFGVAGGFLIVGKTKRDWTLSISAKTLEKTTVILTLSLVSFIIQFLVLKAREFKLPMAALTQQPTTLALFYIGMAYFETLFFPFFLYRGFKEAFIIAKIPLVMSALLSALITSAAFGFAYHAAVYNNDIVYMTNAFIGSMIFCLSQDLTDTFSGGYIHHLLQNLPLSGLAASATPQLLPLLLLLFRQIF